MDETDKKLMNELEKLDTNFWSFRGVDTSDYTHKLHSYPAVMIPPISKHIIKIMQTIMPINTLLDPFVGSGTVLIEGKLANIPIVTGNDINPLALFLCKVKTKNINTKNICNTLCKHINIDIPVVKNINDYMATRFDLRSKDWGSNAHRYIKEYLNENNYDINIPDFKNMGYWFKPNVILILQLIKDEIMKIQDIDIKNFVLCAFSETVRLVSNKRNSEFKMYRINEDKFNKFNPDVLCIFEQILNNNIIKMDKFHNYCIENNIITNTNIYNNDSTSLTDIQNDYYDIVITSPPYGDSKTTVAYGEFSRLSLQWLGYENATQVDKILMGGTKRNKEILKSETINKTLDKIRQKDEKRAEQVYNFYYDLQKSIEAVTKKLKTNKYQFWVVGNRTVKEQILHTDIIITEMSKHYGLNHIATLEREIQNKVMPSLNAPTNKPQQKSSTMTKEYIVILKKVC